MKYKNKTFITTGMQLKNNIKILRSFSVFFNNFKTLQTRNVLNKAVSNSSFKKLT